MRSGHDVPYLIDRLKLDDLLDKSRLVPEARNCLFQGLPDGSIHPKNLRTFDQNELPFARKQLPQVLPVGGKFLGHRDTLSWVDLWVEVAPVEVGRLWLFRARCCPDRSSLDQWPLGLRLPVHGGLRGHAPHLLVVRGPRDVSSRQFYPELCQRSAGSVVAA